MPILVWESRGHNESLSLLCSNGNLDPTWISFHFRSKFEHNLFIIIWVIFFIISSIRFLYSRRFLVTWHVVFSTDSLWSSFIVKDAEELAAAQRCQRGLQQRCEQNTAGASDPWLVVGGSACNSWLLCSFFRCCCYALVVLNFIPVNRIWWYKIVSSRGRRHACAYAFCLSFQLVGKTENAS